MPKTKAKPAAKADWRVENDLRRKKQAAALITAGLREYERAFLATCQLLFRSDTGCNTPFEKFFRNIVLHVQICGWPTPEDVESELQDFKRNFRDMQRDAESFRKAYLPKAESAAPEVAQPTRKGTSGHPLARKPRKKAAHAG